MNAKIIAIVAIVVIGIAFLYYGGQWVNSMIYPTPPVGIEISIDKSSMNVGDYATMTVAVTNNDLKTHNVQFQFDVSSKLTVYAGRESALPNNAYSWSLDATSKAETKTFTLSGTLGDKESSTNFPIKLHVIVDGSELRQTWKDLSIEIKG